jgi:hypothetical protein
MMGGSEDKERVDEKGHKENWEGVQEKGRK